MEQLQTILEALLTSDTQRVADELEKYRERQDARERYLARLDEQDLNRMRNGGY